MWRIRKSRLDSETEHWRLLAKSGEDLSFEQVFSRWRADEEFRGFWSASLHEVPFESYCWECPPATAQCLTPPFECVFVSSPLLAELPPDPEPFAEHFRPDLSVATFESLGKDALLVAPCPAGQGANFAHLASFLDSATDAQKSDLWQAVGDAVESRIGARPTWLSTAGLGVAWLHVRLDTRPKYYRHGPYKLADQRLR